MRSGEWFAIRKPVKGIHGIFLKLLAFLIPLGIWCAVSYCPFIWHPLVEITLPGDSGFEVGSTCDPLFFAANNKALLTDGKSPAQGIPANPVYLPAPHKVAKAFYTAFTTEPARRDDGWLHQSLLQSILTIFYGFTLAALIAVPLGIFCGTFDALSKLTEPYIDFIRYMPPPVFGPLMMAALGMFSGPKIAIIFIGAFFNMVLVVSNTARNVDPALLEAAQTLGASRFSLVIHVIIPAMLPGLFKDLRILLGSAWTYLTVAELIGEMGGISRFINQQGKYRHFDNVYAGIIMIGMIGLITDQFLSFLGTLLFPWTPETNHRARRWFRWLGILTRPVEHGPSDPATPEELAAAEKSRAKIFPLAPSIVPGSPELLETPEVADART